MRQCCQWVNTSCGIPLPPGKKYVAVQLITKDTLYCIVEAKERVHHVFKHISSYLGMKSAELFGLALLLDGEHMFLDPNIKLAKLVSKTWKSHSNNGLDSIGRPLLTLHLRVQFFVDCPSLLRDKQTRHHYYVQLRNNYLQHCQACSEERCFMLAAHALQADVGNYCAARHRGRYFEPTDYFPSWILGRLGEEYVVLNVPCVHKDHEGVSRSEAEMGFIRDASNPNAPHNLHVYKLKKKKNDLLGSVWLGVCTRGIQVYENGGVNSPTKKLMSTFLWADIRKLCFEKKKFEIVVVSFSEGSRKYTYYTASAAKSKHLLHLCRSTHQFNLAIQPRLQELRRIEMVEEEKRRRSSYRESYIYSDTSDLEWEQEHGHLARDFDPASSYLTATRTTTTTTTTAKKKSTSASMMHGNVVVGQIGDQRTSVISNASSTTTSGIVSDRVMSLDGSEDEDMTREPDSPQPQEKSVEAINHSLLSAMAVEHQDVTVSLHPRASEGSRDEVEKTIKDAVAAIVSSVDVDVDVHSSSSEKSTLSVRSCDQSVPNEIIDVVGHSDTCSSFDYHSYTSSLDSSTLTTTSTTNNNNRHHGEQESSHPPPPPPRRFVQSSAASSTDESDWMIDSEMSSTTSLTAGSSYSGGATSVHLPLTCAGMRTNSRLRSRLSPMSSSSNLSALQQSKLQHQVPVQCRTKIGISSLSRASNPGSTFPTFPALAMAAAHQQMKSGGLIHLDSMAAGWLQHSRNRARNNHNLMSPSGSVPNVVIGGGATTDDLYNLHQSAMATFPPSCRNACCLPARSNHLHQGGGHLGRPASMTLTTTRTPIAHYDHYAHWSVPNFFVNELDLMAISNSRPPCAVPPPPPPYRDLHHQEAVPHLTSLLHQQQKQLQHQEQLQHQQQRARICLPVKAKSEDNILFQGLGSRQLFNMTGGLRTGVSSNQPPPAYGADSLAKSVTLYRSASSVTAPQQTREQLLDFQKLRERSRHLDLPLITALCNDRSLNLMAAPSAGPNKPVHMACGETLDAHRRLSYCSPPVNCTSTSTRPISWHVDSGFGGAVPLAAAYPHLATCPPTVNNNYLLQGPSSTSKLLTAPAASPPCKPLTLIAQNDAWHPYYQTTPATTGLC